MFLLRPDYHPRALLGPVLILLICANSLIILPARVQSLTVSTTRRARPPTSATMDHSGGEDKTPPRLPTSSKTIPAPHQATTAQTREAYGKLPLSFEANQGQTDSQVKFLARGNGYSLLLSPTEAVLSLRKPAERKSNNKSFPLCRPAPNSKSTTPTAVVRMKLMGANPAPAVEGIDELPGKSNYFIGSNPEQWRTNIPSYAKVKHKDVYPGVDMIYYGDQRQLEYDFVVAPGAKPDVIQMSFAGVKNIRIDRQGDLVLQTDGGELRQHKPIVYQETSGVKQQIEGHYLLKGRRQVGFEIVEYDPSRPLIIDPVIIYSTYLGGAQGDFATGIAVNAAGEAYVTGYTNSANFPTVNPVVQNDGSYDAFVTKLNAAGTALVYSTYLGGNGSDLSYDIAVDAAGSAYLTGFTASTNFPLANPLQSTNGGDYDAFVTKLNAAGASLIYSTYLGGSGGNGLLGSGDGGIAIAVDAAGNAFVTGQANSTNFPTVNPLQPGISGNADAFVTKLNATGSALVYSTYLGGSGDDGGMGVAVDAAGNAIVTGYTRSMDFRTANPLQLINRGGITDAFVTKFNATGTALIYSTYLGGSDDDQGDGIAVDSAGNAYVVGTTGSIDFPTANPLRSSIGGRHDAFVTKLNAAGTALVYSTYLGGSGEDGGIAIAVDPAGNAYLAGYTFSADFPTANPLQPLPPDGAIVTKLNAQGTALIYSTYLGGADSAADYGMGIALGAPGYAYVTGYTFATDFPTASPIQASNQGGADAFVTKIFDSSVFSVGAIVSNRGGNSGEVSATIIGAEFEPGSTVKLKAINQPDIEGSSPTVIDASSMTATFDLRGTSPGLRDVVVTLPDSSTATLRDGFTIESGGASRIWVDIVGPRRIRLGREQTFYIAYGNRGNIDASHISLWFSFPKELTWQLDPHVSSFGKYETATEITLAINVGKIPVSHSPSIPIRLTNSAASANLHFQMKAWWSDSQEAIFSRSNGKAKPDSNSQGAGSKGLIRNRPVPSLVDCVGVNRQTCPDPRGPGGSCDPHCIECFRQKGEIILAGFNFFRYVLPANHLEHFLSNTAGPIEWGAQSKAAEVMASNSFFKNQHVLNLKFWRLRALMEARALGIGGTRDLDLQGGSLSNIPFYPTFLDSWFGLAVGSVSNHNDVEIAFSFGTMNNTSDRLQGSVFRTRDGSTGCETVGFSGRIKYQMNDRYTFPIEVGRPYDYEGGYLQACAAAQSFPTSLEVEMPFSYFESTCSPPPPCDGCTTTIDVNSVTSMDPNEKIGAPGVGPSQFISGEEPLRYAIAFENKETATAPAQEVVVTDQLDILKFDLDSFSFGPITIGSHFVVPPHGANEFIEDIDLVSESHLLVKVIANLNKNSGLITWRFTGIDPNTGEPPSDPSAGFLPPGGGGSVLFTAMPRHSLATASVIRNKATIVFDGNPPLVTAEWSNTLDNSKPASHVLPLPVSQSSAGFNVQWSGTDTGSGIGNYTIYLSDNGAPFTPWLTQTTATQAAFASTANHTYSFFSVARDLTGNTEGLKTAAEATTQILGVAGIASRVTDPYGNGVKGVTMTLSGARSGSTQTNDSGASSFASLPTGNYTVTPAKPNYAFTPANRTFNNLSADQTGDFIATVLPGAPILVTEETSTRAVALDSVLWFHDPFKLDSPVPWGLDTRTRLTLFVMNLDLLAGETPSIVAADAEDAAHRSYPLTVEYLGRVPGRYWLSYVIVRLNDDLHDPGDVLVRISARGVPSNRVRLGIGHTGGGPPDDSGAIPTPGREP